MRAWVCWGQVRDCPQARSPASSPSPRSSEGLLLPRLPGTELGGVLLHVGGQVCWCLRHLLTAVGGCISEPVPGLQDLGVTEWQGWEQPSAPWRVASSAQAATHFVLGTTSCAFLCGSPGR